MQRRIMYTLVRAQFRAGPRKMAKEKKKVDSGNGKELVSNVCQAFIDQHDKSVLTCSWDVTRFLPPVQEYGSRIRQTMVIKWTSSNKRHSGGDSKLSSRVAGTCTDQLSV